MNPSFSAILPQGHTFRGILAITEVRGVGKRLRVVHDGLYGRSAPKRTGRRPLEGTKIKVAKVATKSGAVAGIVDWH